MEKYEISRFFLTVKEMTHTIYVLLSSIGLFDFIKTCRLLFICLSRKLLRIAIVFAGESLPIASIDLFLFGSHLFGWMRKMGIDEIDWFQISNIIETAIGVSYSNMSWCIRCKHFSIATLYNFFLISVFYFNSTTGWW